MFATHLSPWGPGPGPTMLFSCKATWVQGLFLSLIVGGLVTWPCLKLGRWNMTRRLNGWELEVCRSVLRRRGGSVPGLLMGLVERGFFTCAVAADTGAAIAAMPVWLAVKLAANWQRAGPDRFTRSAAILAVVIGLISMLFALGGGLTWQGHFGDPPVWAPFCQVWDWLLAHR